MQLFLLDGAVPGAETEDLHDALADLAGVSMVTREVESERFMVHPLVQDVTLRALDRPAWRCRLAEARGWVNAVRYNCPGAVHSWPGFLPFFPHVRRVNEWAAAEREADRIAASYGLVAPDYTADASGGGDRRGEARAGSSDVARRLYNLAGLLKDTSRLAEAEPLMRWHVAIFIDFERKNGHPHPHRDTALRNYARLLAAMGKSEAEIGTAIASLAGEDGSRDPH